MAVEVAAVPLLLILLMVMVVVAVLVVLVRYLWVKVVKTNLMVDGVDMLQ